ncbi:MAG TPA: hypothetical protein PKK26_19230, partial [Candidatus Wallbacteria bacterium]|nr:hypothetical protein [Candidatus Wallbacteria bacterium]
SDRRYYERKFEKRVNESLPWKVIARAYAAGMATSTERNAAAAAVKKLNFIEYQTRSDDMALKKVARSIKPKSEAISMK